MVSIGGYEFNLTEWGVALGFFIGSILLADIVIVTVDRLIRPLLAKTKTTLDDLLFENLRGPLKLFFAIFGAYLGLRGALPNLQLLGRNLEGLLGIALIIAGGHAIDRVLNAVMRWYMQEIGIKENRVGDIFPLMRKLIKIAVYVGTGVVVLSELGVEIGPLIAGLGIAGLAVALALQDSLKNFFAGIYLLADKPIRVGDLIALDSDNSDVKGVVEEIGWRSTRIRTQTNHTYIIPNEKLAQSVIINYSKGKDTKVVLVKVGVEYSVDVEKALAALNKAAEQTLKTSEFVDPTVAPMVRVNEFLDSSIELATTIRVKKYEDRFLLASDLRKNILAVFKKEKISIPFPIRTLYLHHPQEKKR